MTQRHPEQSDNLFFVTTNIKNRRPIFENPVYAREAVETLYRIQELHSFFLHGFVIMPDHCHFLLFVTEEGNLSKMMRQYKSGVAFNIGIGSLWQPRFHSRYPEHASRMLHYIHMNPVRAGLVERPEDYPWSSASGKWDSIGLNDL